MKKLNIEVEDDDSNPAPPPSYGMDPRQILTVPFGDRINITTPWLFHTGPGKNFVDPYLDDHDWLVLDTSQPLFNSEIYNANEIWYRTHIRVAPFSHDLALTVAEFGGSYRVYANGVDIGGRGRMGGRGDYLFARSSTFAIPNSVLDAPELVIVIHAYVGTADRVSLALRDGISANSSVFLGPASILRRDEKFYFANGMTESTGVLTPLGRASLPRYRALVPYPRRPCLSSALHLRRRPPRQSALHGLRGVSTTSLTPTGSPGPSGSPASPPISPL